MDQNTKAKNLLLYVFLTIYVLTALGTLSMLFFGIGAVRDDERQLLINTFLIESAVAIAALFYSLWGLKKKEDAVLEHTKELIVNPLEESFKDLVIPIEALRLPQVQLHENKHFKRCKFIGPAAMTFLGSTFRNTNFIDCGDVVPIPENTFLTGVVALKDCTIEDCEFIRTTLLIPKVAAEEMVKQVPGMRIAGS
ncbi:hypothetical protein [Methylomonas sp. MgM2]